MIENANSIEELRQSRKAAAPNGQKNNTADGVKTISKGYDIKTGKAIYESNFPKETPKSEKAARILSYIQNVWSKSPIELVITNDDGSTRIIKAEFDPTYEENIKTDASKLMGGNRHGTASEQRVTLNLADDYYEMLQESKYNYSKDEEGKTSETHEGVKEWHYFINDILYQEYGETGTTPYRVTINIKEKSSGNYLYSFSAEKQNKLSTRQTLHADVSPITESERTNAQLIDKISQDDTSSQDYSMRKNQKDSSDGTKSSAKGTENLERDANGDYNTDIRYSKKNWHTDLTKKQVIEVEESLRRIGRPEETRITDKANWYMGRMAGQDMLVIYSTEDIDNPTILY